MVRYISALPTQKSQLLHKSKGVYSLMTSASEVHVLTNFLLEWHLTTDYIGPPLML